MSDLERLDERLTAVEQTVVDGDYQLDELEELAAAVDDLERIERRLDDVEGRLADLESRSQAIEGFVGNVRAVNDEVEARAETALAVVDRLEDRVEELEVQVNVDPGRGDHAGGGPAVNDAESRADDILGSEGTPGLVSTNGGPGTPQQRAQQGGGPDSGPKRVATNGSGGSGEGDSTDQDAVEKNFTPSDATDDEGLLERLKSVLS